MNIVLLLCLEHLSDCWAAVSEASSLFKLALRFKNTATSLSCLVRVLPTVCHVANRMIAMVNAVQAGQPLGVQR